MQTLRKQQTEPSPLPWIVKSENEYLPVQVYAGDMGQPVADVFGNSRAERSSRGNLIAAAPELLEVARMIGGPCLFDALNPCTASKVSGKHWGSTPENPVEACAACKALWAIAKAEGKR